VPFAAIAALAFAATLLRTDDTDWRLLALDGVFAALVAAVAAVTPWQRLPASAVLVLPVACDTTIGLLRHARGGSTSGYSSLAVLPVLWAALALPRWTVGATAARTTLLFALPSRSSAPRCTPRPAGAASSS